MWVSHMRPLIHKPHARHGNTENWAPGVSSWLQLWNTPGSAPSKKPRAASDLNGFTPEVKNKICRFANWKFLHIHAERFRESGSISSSIKRCCSEDDPPDCLTIPTLNRGNGWHKSTLHVLQETGPSLWTSLWERDRQGKKKKKRKRNFPWAADSLSINSRFTLLRPEEEAELDFWHVHKRKKAFLKY